MGSDKFNTGGNPAIQGRVKKYSSLFYAKETGISSGLIAHLGIRRFGEFPGRHEVIQLKFWDILSYKFFFWKCVPKIWDDIPDFQDDFYLHTVLLKQNLLGLSPYIV